MLRYGDVDSAEALRELTLGEGDALKLWLSRLLTLLMMFGGFLLLHGVTHTTAQKVRLCQVLGPVPFATWRQYIGAAFALSVLLWVAVVLVAYVVGIIHLALTLIGGLAAGLFLNNKTPVKEGADKKDQ